MPEYRLPDPGEGLTEAEIVTWRVSVGDVVEVNDVVVEVETAKSLVELPSPYAGTVTALLVAEGDTVAVGAPIISIGEAAGPTGAADDRPDDRADDGSDEAAPGGDSATGTGTETDTAQEGGSTLVGYGPRAASSRRRPRRGGASPRTAAGSASQEHLQGAFEPGAGPADAPDELAVDAPPVEQGASDDGAVGDGAVEDGPAEESSGEQDAVPARDARAGGRVDPHGHTARSTRALAKPPVRRLARDLGVDLASLTATGPRGTVSREDVEQAAESTTAPSSDTGHAPSDTGRAASTEGGADERREPVSGVGRAMASAMTASAFTAPHVTEWVTVDVTATTELIARLRARRELREVPVGPLLVLARAVLLAMRRTPLLNSVFDAERQEVVHRHRVNLGIAAATPRGLVVPHVKDAGALSLAELGTALAELTATAREGRTTPAAMSGGTFTITNVGVFGVDAGTPIINPGESGILCFGAVRRRPWVVEVDGVEQVVPRDVTTLALSFDHRHVDGQAGSRFLADVASILHDPAVALAF